MNKLNSILAILAASYVMVLIIGNILDDKSYWIISDIFGGSLLAVISFRLFKLRNK